MLKWNRTAAYWLTTVALIGLGCAASARVKSSSPALTERGEQLKTTYEQKLASLQVEIAAAIPAIDDQKKAAFLAARATLNALKSPDEGAAAGLVAEHREAKEKAEADVLKHARAVLADVDEFLSSDRLDAKLMTIAILTHGTPQGLAEFAQKGETEEGLIEKLLDDPALMEQVLLAGGANGGEYGEAMAVYAAIQAASERAREPGILQRLALGTSLHQPWLKGRDRGGVYGIVYPDSSGIDQVARYLHYEKAYLAGELDPAFTDMNTWECRFITNDPYRDEDLAWTREMMRNYRPDHITNPDYKWRYVRIVKSDVPYKTPDWRPEEGTSKCQQILAGGGKCGPRAFYGRTALRAFGIPARRSTQTGHAALNHWTPDGWVVCFGAWWAHNWCGPWGGLDFLLDSQAREHEQEYRKVLRAQWIGDVLEEEDVSIRYYGKGGGLWNALAFHKKEAVIEDAQQEARDLELAKLSAEEATRQLGESDEAPDDEEEEKGIEIPEKDRTIVVAEDGAITIPVAACAKPTNSTQRILFMKNLDDEIQVHYSRLGKRPELLKYYVEVPKAGKYSLTAHVATVARRQTALLRLNRRTLIDIPLPFSLGMWQDTEPLEVELREGRNTLMLTCNAPNRGLSIKRLELRPIK